MLEGINVLNETVVYEVIFNFKIFFCVIILSMLLGFVPLLASGEGIVDSVFGAIVGGLIGMFIGIPILLFTAKSTDKINYIEYKVTIDETVSFTEFNEKYEIIEQDGAIYTIKEREE